MSVATHYTLACYAGAGRTAPSPFTDTTTFTRIFQQRPDGLRFAIARPLVLVSVGERLASHLVHRLADEWVAFDLYHEVLAQVPASGRFCAPPPVWRGPSSDGLIMRAVHHG